MNRIRVKERCWPLVATDDCNVLHGQFHFETSKDSAWHSILKWDGPRLETKVVATGFCMDPLDGQGMLFSCGIGLKDEFGCLDG